VVLFGLFLLPVMLGLCGTSSGSDAKDRVPAGDALELRQRDARIDRDVRAGTGSDGQVAAQHGGAEAGVDLREADVFAASVPQYRPAVRRAYVVDPRGTCRQRRWMCESGLRTHPRSRVT
jgi:hypothetical protein